MSVKEKFIDLVLRGKNLFTPMANKASEELRALQAETKEASSELSKLEKTQTDLQKTRGLELYAERAEQSLAAARAEVTRLAREIDASTKPTKEQNEALKLATRSANQLQTEYNKLTGQLSKARVELTQAGVNTDRLADEQDRLQRETSESAKALVELRNRTRDASKALREGEKDSKSFSGSLGGMATRLVAIGATYIGLSQVTQAVKDLFTVGASAERFELQMAGLMGSIEAGEDATRWIEKFADNTGTYLNIAKDGFTQLKNFGIDPMNGSLQALTDYNARLGGDQEKLKGIILAVGQAWSKQKLQGEEILQLVERGVPVWELLEKATGKNVEELNKLSTAGKLGRDVIASLLQELGKSSEGFAAAGLGTFSGQLALLSNQWVKFQQSIADSGALVWLNEQITDLNVTIKEMAANGELQRWAKDISEAIVSIGSGIKTTAKTLYAFSGVIATVASTWAVLKVGNFFKDLTKDSILAGASVLKWLGIIKTAEAANGTWLTSLSSLTAKIKDVLGATNAWLKSSTGIAGMLAKGGIFAGIAFGVFELGRLAKAWYDARQAQAALIESEHQLRLSQNQTLAALEELNQQLGTAFKSFEAVWQAQDEGRISLNQTTGQWELLSTAIADNVAAQEEYLNAVKESGAAAAQALEDAYKTLGIESTEALLKSAEAAKAAYETIVSGNEPIEQQKAAFLKWAEAAIKSAEATGDAVPHTVKARAATLGLAKELEGLTKKSVEQLKQTENQGKAYSELNKGVDDAKRAVEDYRQTLQRADLSSKQRIDTAKKLAEAEKDLAEKSRKLDEVKQIEIATYAQLLQKYREYSEQLRSTEELYKLNGLTAEQYNKQKERLVDILSIIQPLLKGMKDGEKGLQEQTDFANKSLSEQNEILAELSGTAGRATEFISLFAEANNGLTKQFDFTTQSTEQLSSRVKELEGYISNNQRVTGVWWYELARLNNEAFTREKQLIHETLLMRDYIAQLNSGAMSTDQLRKLSNSLSNSFRELGEQDLAPLRNAIADAERRILTLRDGLAGTVSSLQDELDRINNNQAAIEQRRYQAQLIELKDQLEEAQKSGDHLSIQAAQQALKLAKDIYDIKTAQIKAEKNAQTQTNFQQPADTTNSSASSPKAQSTAAILPSTLTRTVRVLLVMPSGREYEAAMPENGINAFLSELERARSTSL